MSKEFKIGKVRISTEIKFFEKNETNLGTEEYNN